MRLQSKLFSASSGWINIKTLGFSCNNDLSNEHQKLDIDFAFRLGTRGNTQCPYPCQRNQSGYGESSILVAEEVISGTLITIVENRPACSSKPEKPKSVCPMWNKPALTLKDQFAKKELIDDDAGGDIEAGWKGKTQWSHMSKLRVLPSLHCSSPLLKPCRADKIIHWLQLCSFPVSPSCLSPIPPQLHGHYFGQACSKDFPAVSQSPWEFSEIRWGQLTAWEESRPPSPKKVWKLKVGKQEQEWW